MFRRSISCVFACAFGLVLTADDAGAQGRAALVVGNGAYGGDAAIARAAGDARDVGAMLRAQGFDVTVIENVAGNGFWAALAETAASAGAGGSAMLYFIGHGATDDAGEARLLPAAPIGDPADGWGMSRILTTLGQAGAAERLLLLDSCHGAASAHIQGGGALPDPGEVPALFYGAAQTPDQPCPAPADAAPFTLTAQIMAGAASPNLSLFDIFAGSAPADGVLDQPVPFASSTLADDFYLNARAGLPEGLSAEDYAMLERLSPEDRAKMLALWENSGLGGVSTVQNDTLVLSAPVQPVRAAQALRPVNTEISRVSIVAEEVVLTTASAPARSFQPPADGLPEPSIFVGVIAPPPGVDFAYDDLAARQALRAEDAEAFAALVAAGALDPPADQTARAIQTELARMNCYTSGIDGIWGGGSRAAVSRYFLQVGSAPTTLEPVADLYRAIIGREDVACPVQAVAAAPQRATTTRTTTPQRRTTTPAPARAAPAPAPAAPAERRINRSVTGSGVFR